MGKRKFPGIINILMEHSPEVLTGVGIAGMLTTVVLAVRATPKALDLINDERLDRADRDENFIYGSTPLPRKDAIRIAWKCYLPAAITGVLSTVCLISASSVNHKRNAALTTACAISESALRTYQDKVVETIGEKREQTVRDAIAKDSVDSRPVVAREVIAAGGSGTTLCLDLYSGRYFNSDIETLRRAANDVTSRLMDEMSQSLNDFYEEIGLEGIGAGDEVGWNIDDRKIELVFSSQLTKNNVPCLVMDFRVQPKTGFYKNC